MANSEDPDEMQHDAAFHQGLHCLLRLKQSSGTEIRHNLENSTCDLFKHVDINTGDCDQVRYNPVCSATETSCGIEILPEVGLSVTISTETYTCFDIISV